MKALEERAMALLEGVASTGTPDDRGVLVRLLDDAGEPLGFAGRLAGEASLEETLREALALVTRADARFGPAGRALEEGVAQLQLFLVREGEAVSPDHPLRPGEGVHVVGDHRRAVYLAEAGRDPETTLRGGCIAAGLHPDSWEEEGGPLITRLEVQALGVSPESD